MPLFGCYNYFAMAHKNLLIIDGFSLAFRAYYSLPTTMTLNDGQPVNVVFGFLSVMFKSIELFNPDYVCVCFDVKEPTFRHIEFDAYKAHRPPPPEDFISQIPILKEAIGRVNIPILEYPGFEADDILGTLSKVAETENVESLIMTSDQDAFQLVSPLTSVVLNKKGVSEFWRVTPKELNEKYQLTPSQIIDFKALKGDSSDNIPGVKGVGEKTALTLLHEFSTMEGIYENLESIKSKSVKGKLENDKEMAFLSRRLVTIHRDIELSEKIEDLKYSPDWSEIIECFKHYNFKSLVSRYSQKINGNASIGTDDGSQNGSTGSPGAKGVSQSGSTGNAANIKEGQGSTSQSQGIEAAQTLGNYSMISSEKKLKAILPELEGGFAIDLETTSTTVLDAQIVGIALAWKNGEGVYIPCNDWVKDNDSSLDTALFQTVAPATQWPYYTLNPYLKILKPILENETIPKFTHNGKYEEQVLRNVGIFLKGIQFDTMLGAYVAFPGQRVGLKDCALTHLGVEMTSYEDVAGKGKSQIPFNQVPLEQATQYAAADADMTLRLATQFESLIPKKDLTTLYNDIELPSQHVLADMEYTGVYIDEPYLRGLEADFTAQTEVLSKEIFEHAGVEFNINSPKQLSEVLFDKLELPVIKKTKTGRSTDASVLEKLQEHHDIAKALVTYRTIEKLQSTYVKTLPNLVHPFTHKIHTSFNQTVAITGRLSSNNPNLQNIPIRTEEGQKIRKAFIPSPGNILLSVDYSQIELRVIAQLAMDENMISAFQKGEDIHKATAAVVEGVPFDEVTKEQRYKAKAVNFGIIYGVSPHGLAQNINISRSEAKEIIDNYFKSFPGIKTFMDDTIAYAEEHGLVKTEFGRIRPIPELQQDNKITRGFGERTAINTRVQGTAADIMKLAMIRVYNEMKSAKLNSQMVIQVHDELVFDVVPEEKDALEALVIEQMQEVVKWDVPLAVDAAFGSNWQEIS
jgi:DNA polymerase-1